MSGWVDGVGNRENQFPDWVLWLEKGVRISVTSGVNRCQIDDFVAEGSGDYLFLVWDGMIYTTPKDTILEGNPREAGITLAKDTGIRVATP